MRPALRRVRRTQMDPSVRSRPRDRCLRTGQRSRTGSESVDRRALDRSWILCLGVEDVCAAGDHAARRVGLCFLESDDVVQVPKIRVVGPPANGRRDQPATVSISGVGESGQPKEYGLRSSIDPDHTTHFWQPHAVGSRRSEVAPLDGAGRGRNARGGVRLPV